MPEPNDPTLVSVATYSAVADEYEQAFADRRAAEVDRFVRSLPAGGRVLDAGCGPGRDLARFAAAGLVAVGLELNPVFAERARRHATVVHGDLRDVARLLAGERFDGVWADASLVHLERDAAARAMHDLVALLVPGGRLFVSVRSTGDDGWVDEPDGRRWYSVWSAAESAHELDAAGCTIDEVVPGAYTQLWATR
ncbi:MAG: class I SAM-dependent methyltransferase [Acidimicrobiales bacterium]